MTPDQQKLIKGALVAWNLAIEERLQHLSDVRTEDLARQFGADITDHEHLKIVSEWFNWDKILDYLDKAKELKQ